MVKYRLLYFNGMGRAEIVRYIMALNDVEYEDVRIEKPDWPTHKPNTPYGQVPVLEVDGVQICQSNAIARYLSKQFGLAGKDDLEAAKVDMIVDCCEDGSKALVAMHYEQDAAKKEELKTKYREEHLPNNLEKIEKLLVANNGGDGYIVGSDLTWADLVLTLAMTWPPKMGVEMPWDKAPKLKALCERVEAHPKIAAWHKKRPQTPF